MNGFQVLKAIRQVEGLTGIPVIFLSAIGSVTGGGYDPDKIQAHYGVRFDDFMPKTVEPDAVRERLASFSISQATS